MYDPKRTRKDWLKEHASTFAYVGFFIIMGLLAYGLWSVFHPAPPIPIPQGYIQVR